MTKEECYENIGLVVIDGYIRYNELNEHLCSPVEIVNELNQLSKENKDLKSIKTFAERNGINIFNIDEAFRKCWKDNGELVKENGQLKQRLNDFKHEIHRLKHELKCATIDSDFATQLEFQEIQKENEQLKKELDNVDDCLTRDDIQMLRVERGFE